MRCARVMVSGSWLRFSVDLVRMERLNGNEAPGISGAMEAVEEDVTGRLLAVAEEEVGSSQLWKAIQDDLITSPSRYAASSARRNAAELMVAQTGRRSLVRPVARWRMRSRV